MGSWEVSIDAVRAGGGARVKRRFASWLGVAAFLLGLWQLMSPVAVGLGFADQVDGVRDAVVAGAIVVVVSLVCMMTPLDARWTGLVLTLSGWWIAANPWLNGIRQGEVVPVVNALAIGCAVALVGVAMTLVTRPR
ncbi:SPW repeat protein [Saccharothrix longispora]|uniref:Dipeptide/tripeptide permease n=1 Tax=Saccharothrix longispora TaxID=33920 RepID=A0ABU1PWG1_9PSEU|nr:SPW repeat protein [Saccharothrix longispora]MDR6594771.1 dipeptide/tripeptide permease [Saccharothrix longispora]